MDKTHIIELFSAYLHGWSTFEYQEDEEYNCREVYNEMKKFIKQYCLENNIEDATIKGLL